MDIVAETLSAKTLRAGDVRVGGASVQDWLEARLSGALSSAVWFAGVFDDLSAAPARSGAVAIVGQSEYVYSDDGGWREFGDEGAAAATARAVGELSAAV